MTTGRLPSIEGGIQPTIVDAKGDLIAATAADTVSKLSVGANDTVLTADSSTATGLKWAAVAGGQTLISTTTLSAATSISLTSIPTTYKHLRILFIDCFQSASDVYWTARFNNDSGTVYYYNTSAIKSNATAVGNAQDVATSIGTSKYFAPIPTTYTQGDNGGTNGYFDVYNYASTTLKRSFAYTFAGYSTADNVYANGYAQGHYHTTGTAITRIDFIRSSTQTITGTLQLWGIS
jgi:hypothetical protein